MTELYNFKNNTDMWYWYVFMSCIFLNIFFRNVYWEMLLLATERKLASFET